ncbi:MAG: DUF2141 domain-containing protein [Defluviicoccus sp.]|nr:DUF2141 domain-containing protein [Defluviicoccus sp.]MDE0383035.1 DUF2141 domain-containing protein [Defluviicoccus sp.]
MTISRTLGVCGTVAAALLVSSTAVAADLEVVVDGLRSAQGQARVAVHKRVPGAAFPEGGVVAAAWRTAGEGALRFVFADLAPGDYAVAAFHDADGDGKLGQNMVGLPTEGFGFSNGATGFMGPPSFDEAAVTIGPKDERVSVAVPIAYSGS